MFFSVLTPTYNRCNDLKIAYKSLKEQTFKDFEWIIVDDGSTDDTKTIVDGFINDNILNIVYISQKHGGKHIAMRTAYTRAHGKYFFSLDSDDQLYSKHTLETVQKAIQNTPADYPWVAGCFINQSGTVFPKFDTDYMDFDKQKFLDAFTSSDAYMLNICSCMRADFVRSVMPPEIYDNLSFFPECVIGLRLVMQNPNFRMRLFNQKWYKYNTGRQDSVSVNIDRTNANWWQAKSLAEDFHKWGLDKQYHKFYLSQLYGLFRFRPNNKSLYENYKVLKALGETKFFYKHILKSAPKFIFSISNDKKGKKYIKIMGLSIHL